jgi:hypothetical protein
MGFGVLQWWRVFQLGKFGIVVSPTVLLLVVLDLVMSNLFFRVCLVLDWFAGCFRYVV